MATASIKRTLAAAEFAMARKESSRCMFRLPPERIRYLQECVDGLHPCEWLPPEEIASMREEMWSKV
jgi:hypothetical protein